MCSKCKCPYHQPWWRRFFFCRRRLTILISITLTVAITIVLTWAVLRPHKPSIILRDITVNQLNISTVGQTYLLSSSFQLTISGHNTDNRHSLFYDRLGVYLSFNDQQITLRTLIPPTYQGQGEDNVWSPLVCGESVPIAPDNAIALNQDETKCLVMMKVKLQGSVRWKLNFGGFTTTGLILVDCPVFLSTGTQSSGVVVGNNNAIKYQLMRHCSVH